MDAAELGFKRVGDLDGSIQGLPGLVPTFAQTGILVIEGE